MLFVTLVMFLTFLLSVRSIYSIGDGRSGVGGVVGGAVLTVNRLFVTPCLSALSVREV